MVAAVGLTAGAADSPAPSGASPLELGLAEDVEVRYVLVDVLAVDRRERTVADLGADELTLLVDGREMPIASLDRVCPMGAAADAGSVAATPSPSLPAAAEPPQIALVFDYYHITNVAETFDRVTRMLDDRATGDERHMIVSLGDSLRIESPWTADLHEVRRALERMRSDPDLWAGHHGRLTEWPFFERVETLFDLLERVPGRKTIVLFSGPFFPDGFYHDASYRQLSAMSTIARTAVYPVDTGGLRTLIDPDARPLGGPAELRRLANDTGGRMTADTNDIGLAYARAQRDLGCSYTIGFREPHPRPDDRRRLTIRVARRGVRLVYPEFYVIRSIRDKGKSLLRTASVAPQSFESERVRTEMRPVERLSERRWRAELVIEVALAPDEEVATGEPWTIKGLVRKPNGTLVRSFRRKVSALPAGAAGASRKLECSGSFSLPAGRYLVSAVVQPPGTTEPLTASRAVVVPPGAPPAALASGP